jgi:DNA modification methylase
VAEPYYSDDTVTLYNGDALAVLGELPDGSVNCVVTSPPYYGLRDYGEPGQYGLEATPAEYVERMREVFAEVRRVLAVDGTLWLNLGDTYAGKANAGASVGRTRRADRAELIPPRVNSTAEAPYKSLLMVPERVAWSLIEDGWCLRNRIVWHKPNAMPESVVDRLANRHEVAFLLVRSARYWFDLDAVREPQEGRGQRHKGRSGYREDHPSKGRVLARALHPLGRNPGDVWTIPLAPFPEAHFATFPPDFAERCVLAGCRPGGTVLDLFAGSCTTGMVALKHGRRFVGIDLSQKYLDLALRTRLSQTALIEEVPDGVRS